MAAEGSMNYVVEKLRETERVIGEESWLNYVVEKLKEWLVVLESWGESLIGKVEEWFPPESRGEQLHFWLQFATAASLIFAAVLLLWLCCCYFCGCGRGRGCCCRGGRRSVKMMKAPGRHHMMPRHDFEADPRSYFRNLRGNPIDDDDLV